MATIRDGLYNPLLMATPTGGSSKNEQFFMQFKARCAYQSTHNVLNFLSNPEDPTHDGPRVFTKLYGTNNTQVSLGTPFKNEFKSEIRALMEGVLKKVKAELITSMPVEPVSLWLWRSEERETPGDRVIKLFSFPLPGGPQDTFTFPSSGLADIRIEKDKWYYYCFEFDDLIARTRNFGIELTADIWWGDGP